MTPRKPTYPPGPPAYIDDHEDIGPTPDDPDPGNVVEPDDEIPPTPTTPSRFQQDEE